MSLITEVTVQVLGSTLIVFLLSRLAFALLSTIASTGRRMAAALVIGTGVSVFGLANTSGAITGTSLATAALTILPGALFVGILDFAAIRSWGKTLTLSLPVSAMLVVVAGFGALFGAGMLRENPNAVPSTREGSIVPPLIVAALGEKPVFDQEALSGDGMKLVNFWASWCPPCRAEHPNLVVLAEEGLPVYGVNFKDSTSNALAFLDELGDPYAGIIADPNGRNGLNWTTIAMPETFLIGPGGEVLWHFRGPITQRVMERDLRPLLGAEPGS